MDEYSIKYLSEFTGEDPEKIRNLTPTQLQKAKDRPSLLKGILDGNVEVSNDGTVRNTYKYKNSSTYKRIQALDDNSMIPSDLIAEMLNPLVRYSMEKKGTIPKVDYIPDIPMGSNGISKESLLLYMDRVNDGLVNDDMAHYTLDLEAKKDTKVSSLLGSNLKFNFLQKIDHEATVKNFSNLINRVSFDNPKKGEETFVDAQGNIVDVRFINEEDIKNPTIDASTKQFIDNEVSDAAKQGMSPYEAKKNIEEKLMSKYGKSVTFSEGGKKGEVQVLPNEAVQQLRSSMYNLGYGKDMVIAKNPTTGSEDIAFKSPITYSVEGDMINLKSSYGRNVSLDITKVNPALRSKVERNKALSAAVGFKANADYITGPIYGIAFE